MSLKVGISSHSLGRAWVHKLDKKLDEAAKQRYDGVEVFYEDLEYLARSYPGGLNDDNLLLAAQEFRSMCDVRNLEILCLQPFMHYEGLTDADEHAERIEKMKHWFRLAKTLRTDVIQIPSNFQSEGTTGDREAAVRDLKEVAAMGLQQQPIIKFAYEALCWGKHVDLWEQSWEICQAVDSPNFGLCLDTFNITGRCWADPSRPDGKIENADEILRQSMKRMRETVDVSKIYFVQVVDAERLRNPLTKDHVFHVDGQAPRMSWSRNCRLFPFEKAAYLPIIDVLRTITEDLGYTGWISFELFSRTMADPDASVPAEHARRGMESWRKLVKVMGWEKRIFQQPSVPVIVSSAAYEQQRMPVMAQQEVA